MNPRLFKILIGAVGVAFTIVFCVIVIPALIEKPNIIDAFAGGFVNPFASGYSTDVICCWLLLLIWIIYESPKVKYGWVCALLGIIPGVAVGFALYLLLRMKYLSKTEENALI